MKEPYWILWAVDAREPIMRRGKPHRYMGTRGLVPCDPSKRTAFSYFGQLWSYPGTSSVWTYDRKWAHRFGSKKEAMLMRRFVFEAFKVRYLTEGRTPRDCYGISRVSRRSVTSCVSPSGRTDFHGSYAETLDGVMVCAFCKGPLDLRTATPSVDREKNR